MLLFFALLSIWPRKLLREPRFLKTNFAMFHFRTQIIEVPREYIGFVGYVFAEMTEFFWR